MAASLKYIKKKEKKRKKGAVGLLWARVGAFRSSSSFSREAPLKISKADCQMEIVLEKSEITVAQRAEEVASKSVCLSEASVPALQIVSSACFRFVNPRPSRRGGGKIHLEDRKTSSASP